MTKEVDCWRFARHVISNHPNRVQSAVFVASVELSEVRFVIGLGLLLRKIEIPDEKLLITEMSTIRKMVEVVAAVIDVT